MLSKQTTSVTLTLTLLSCLILCTACPPLHLIPSPIRIENHTRQDLELIYETDFSKIPMIVANVEPFPWDMTIGDSIQVRIFKQKHLAKYFEDTSYIKRLDTHLVSLKLPARSYVSAMPFETHVSPFQVLVKTAKGKTALFTHNDLRSKSRRSGRNIYINYTFHLRGPKLILKSKKP